MIDSYDLQMLFQKYNINYNKILNKQDYILEKGFYDEIEKVLKYLIEEKKVNRVNIEKCPSILYLNVNNVKDNYEYLINNNLSKNNIDTCLHVLSTQTLDLQKTFEYINKNYGINYIEKATSILKKTVFEIQNRKELFKRYNINEFNIVISSLIFKTFDDEEIEKIIEVCNNNNIKITGRVFRQSAEEIEKIIEVCNNNNIKITGSVFMKPSHKLIDTIKFLKLNYGDEYLISLIIIKDKKHIEKVFNLLKEKKFLKNIIKSSAILILTYEQIITRMSFAEDNNLKIINEKGNFHPIF